MENTLNDDNKETLLLTKLVFNTLLNSVISHLKNLIIFQENIKILNYMALEIIILKNQI